jgi:hypothetical protein
VLQAVTLEGGDDTQLYYATGVQVAGVSSFKAYPSTQPVESKGAVDEQFIA